MLSSLQRLKSANRFSGTFKALAIVLTGRGTANSLTNSTLSLSINESIRPAEISLMAGSSELTARAVNALLTNFRYRVCSGGSIVSIVPTRS